MHTDQNSSEISEKKKNKKKKKRKEKENCSVRKHKDKLIQYLYLLGQLELKKK